ncbi:SETMR methyltransferase, partial [Acromyrmex charruanus]
MRKHGNMLPASICAIVYGPSNCDKMNVLISLLKSPHDLKYRYLVNLLAPIEEIGCFTFSNNSDVIPLSEACGIIHIDYLPSKQTINGDYYAALLDYFNKKKILFHQDNALIYTCPVPMAKFNEFRYELLLHPVYSPNLAPCDYFLFSNLKKWFKGKRFTTREQLIAETEAYFEGLDKSYYSNGLKNQVNFRDCRSLVTSIRYLLQTSEGQEKLHATDYGPVGPKAVLSGKYSTIAGHNSHDNEILSIIEELCKTSLISYYKWRGLFRNYVRDNIVAVDFDVKSRKIRRVALSVDDADAANKLYVQQSVQDLKDRLNEIERKIVVLQNNVQEKCLLIDELHAPARRNFPRRHVTVTILIVIDVLSKYTAKRRTIGMHPIDITSAIADRLLTTVYNYVKIAALARYKVGDLVSVSKFKTVFDKGYTPNWSTEVFKTIKLQQTNPVTYLLEVFFSSPRNEQISWSQFFSIFPFIILSQYLSLSFSSHRVGNYGQL